MSYTLAAAAAACGLNKSTVLRAIKAGKISGTKDEHGEWHIEAAELHRVYPPVAAAAAGNRALPRDAMPAEHLR
jgi:predicted site-specific integrase-resolvase